MKNILSFDDFILNESTQLNEGLLQNLFGALLGRDMWSAVHGENAIKDEFRKIDDKLNGFYLTKIKNPNTSQDVRQTLVDWADEIYKAKKKLKEETDKDKEGDDKEKEGDDKEKDNKENGNDILPVLIGSFKFEGKTEEEIKKEIENNEELKKLSEDTKGKILGAWKKVQDDKELSKKLDELKSEVEKIDKKYQKTLDDVTGSSADLKRWANILKDRMNDIIDKILCGKYDEDSELAKDLEKLQNKEDEELKKKNEEELKKEQEQMKKLKEERDNILKKCGAEITKEKTAADFVKKVIKACQTRELFEEKSVFDGKTKVNLDVYKKSGLEKLLGINVEEHNKSLFDTIFTLNDVVITNLEKDFKKTIKDVSGASMQAFFVSYCNLILECHTKNKNLDDNLLTCMARCSVYNNTLVGFGLPCPDEFENKKDEEKVGMFVYYLDKTIKSWKEDNESGGGLRTTRLEDFRKQIQKKAEELVEEYQKEQEKELKKEEQEQEKENK